MDKGTFSKLLNDAVNQPGMISGAYSAFHGYSIGNQLLAWSQCLSREIPLGPIATYKRWAELGRQVKKGSKAIWLVMPMTINKRDDNGDKTDDVFQMFVMRNNWFVLSQTEGADYAHEVKSAEWDAATAMQKLNITEKSFDLMNGNVQGYAQADSVSINPVAVYPHKTRIHEIAHIVLGHTKEGTMTDSEATPRDTREVEAESVAYILCSLLNLPGLDESRGYIQGWLSGNEISDKSAQKIFAVATKILDAGKLSTEEIQ